MRPQPDCMEAAGGAPSRCGVPIRRSERAEEIEKIGGLVRRFVLILLRLVLLQVLLIEGVEINRREN